MPRFVQTGGAITPDETQLLIGTEAGAKLYAHVEVDALREFARSSTARLDGLMDELASDYYAQQIIDEWRGK